MGGTIIIIMFFLSHLSNNCPPSLCRAPLSKATHVVQKVVKSTNFNIHERAHLNTKICFTPRFLV